MKEGYDGVSDCDEGGFWEYAALFSGRCELVMLMAERKEEGELCDE